MQPLAADPECAAELRSARTGEGARPPELVADEAQIQIAVVAAGLGHVFHLFPRL